MSDILTKLADLHKQATTENSHFYVAGCVEEAMAEIKQLRVERGTMPLAKALYILSEAHTRDDDQIGFLVEMSGIDSTVSRNDYIEAWRSVRFNIGKPTEPRT